MPLDNVLLILNIGSLRGENEDEAKLLKDADAYSERINLTLSRDERRPASEKRESVQNQGEREAPG